MGSLLQGMGAARAWHGSNRSKLKFCMCGSRGGIGGPDPPRNSQVIWVSLDIMIRTPPFPGKSCPPPPPRLENVRPLWILGKVLDPLDKV